MLANSYTNDAVEEKLFGQHTHSNIFSWIAELLQLSDATVAFIKGYKLHLNGNLIWFFAMVWQGNKTGLRLIVME